MKDHSFLIFIISECSRAAVLDFRKAKLKSVQEGVQEQLTSINGNICMSKTPLTLSSYMLLKVTSIENKTEETYYLIKLRYSRLIPLGRKLTCLKKEVANGAFIYTK